MQITKDTKTNSFYVIVTGLFRYNKNTVDEKMLFNDYHQWKHRIFNGNYQSTFDYLNHSYYDSYLSNTFPEIRHDHSPTDHLNPRVLNHLTLKKCQEKPEAFQNFALFNREEKIPFSIEFIDLYLFPFQIGMFSLKLHINQDKSTLGEISDFLNSIRHLSAKIQHSESKECSLKEYVEAHILHPLDQGHDWDIYNPQLKSFIMIDLDQEYEQEELNRILFDIGNVSIIGSAKGIGMFAPSDEYYNEQMNRNKISVFRNWSALSLFDTFTRISMNFPDKFNTWEYDYFNIYIHSLYIKFFLYLTNTELSDVTSADKTTETTRNQFIEFINDWHHSHISYKFLPDLIQDKLLDSLEIHSEIERMEIKVRRINEHFQEKREKTMNFVLTLITLLNVIPLLYTISIWGISMGTPEKFMFPWGSLGISIVTIAGLIVLFISKRK
ncbi:MAG: hypothetical protein C0594_03740 [Marinilabiliales bacterium]|nr:MAG: hypothetical protein C0594_03740 [Marinilabiliales bacterium]